MANGTGNQGGSLVRWSIIAMRAAFLFFAAMPLSVAAGDVPATPWGITPDQRAVDSGVFITVHDPAATGQRPFSVTEPAGVARTNYPVRGGLPFFRGELADPSRIRLFDATSNSVAVQSFVTAWWPEGTVKFLCIDFMTDLEPGGTNSFTLEYGTNVPVYSPGTIAITTNGQTITVDAGLLSADFRTGSLICSNVLVGGQSVLRDAITARCLVSEGDPSAVPTNYPLIIDSVSVVEQGPVQVTLRLDGSYGTQTSRSDLAWQQVCPRYVFHGFVRLYAESARMDMIHSLGYNGDEYVDFIRRYGITVPMNIANGTFEYGNSMTSSASLSVTGDMRLSQTNCAGWTLTGAASANGHRMGGWSALRNASNSVVVGMRNAWQQWPASFAVNTTGDLTLDMHGGDSNAFLDLRCSDVYPIPFVDVGKGQYEKEAPVHNSPSMYNGEVLSTFYGDIYGRPMGLMKISELTIDFSPAINAMDIGRAQHQMLMPWPGKEIFSETRVFGLTGYYPDDLDAPENAEYKETFEFQALTTIDYPIVEHEANQLYGWVDYPDSADFEPPLPGSNRFDTTNFRGGQGWSNGEKINHGSVMLYVASGWRRAWDYAHQLHLHTIGIDLEHEGGDQQTGRPHRHNQVHWGDPAGSPRQCGAFRGWFMDYWLSGHNEIGRSLKETYSIPMGVVNTNFTGSMLEWPYVQAFDMRTMAVTNGSQHARTYSAKGVNYHWPNFLSYQTSGSNEWVRYFESMFHGWTNNPYEVDENTNKVTGTQRYLCSWISDEVVTDFAALGMELEPSDRALPSRFYASEYYFATYGGRELVSEWGQLTGSEYALDLILQLGDYFTARDTADDRAREDPESLTALYRSYEGLPPAYRLLNTTNYLERQEWMQAHLDRRLFLGDPVTMIDDPFTYTAQEWTNNYPDSRIYGKNGSKIMGGLPVESIYTLWFHINSNGVPERSDHYVATTGSDALGDGHENNPWATIGYALTKVEAGHTIHVAAGVYTESDIAIDRPDITIAGDGMDATVVQAHTNRAEPGLARRVFDISDDTTLRDLTIRHGHMIGSSGNEGSGIHIESCTVTLDRVRIADNHHSGSSANYCGGAGIAVGAAGKLTMMNCQVISNSLSSTGTSGDNRGGPAGLLLNAPSGGYVIISNCLFEGEHRLQRHILFILRGWVLGWDAHHLPVGLCHRWPAGEGVEDLDEMLSSDYGASGRPGPSLEYCCQHLCLLTEGQPM